MNKYLKTIGKVIGVLLLLLLIAGFIGWTYIKNSFLDFENKNVEKTGFAELTIDGYTFLDRNANKKLDIYEDDRRSIDERVNDVLSQMTIEEKIHLLKGSGFGSAIGRVERGQGIPGVAGTIVPTLRLGLPTIYLSDGPAGLRIQPTRKGEDRTYYCTAFPIATLLSSTWNTELVNEVGDAMGQEAQAYGIDVILGPGVNLHRHPFCGRNFEYYSEDPVLTGKLGVAIVNGIESNGIGTSVKHFVANNQETNRNFNDTQVSDRAMREIYLKGFEMIVKESQPWTIMSSYNKVNGTYVSENRGLLSDILREDWKFEGLVMSDWFGGSDAVAMINAGNDLIEPGTKKDWKALTKGHKNGTLKIKDIDISVRRILNLIFKSKKMQNYKYNNNPDLKKHAEINRMSAAEGIVLLKNENTLPVQKGKSIALIGVTSYDFIAGGTGSGDVNEAYTISLEAGLVNAGFKINDRAKQIYNDHKAANKKKFIKPEGFQAMIKPFNPPQINYTVDQLKNLASEAEVAIITIGRNSGEGGDRVINDDFLLTSLEQQMIDMTVNAFHAVGKKVIVVLNIGGVIETASWNKKPDAILLAWQGGQEGGNSAADIISGNLNPSGKLPMTFPIRVEDHASHVNFPIFGETIKITDMMFNKKVAKEDMVKNKDYTIYNEGIYVGYRHFDKTGLDVSYPFGYGLSYTTFDFKDLAVKKLGDTLSIDIDVQNSGSVAGKEVAQVYISKIDTKIDRAKQELKGFAKTKSLEPGTAQALSIKIPVSDLRYWDETKGNWVLEAGSYEVRVGESSRRIVMSKRIEL